MQYRVLVFQGDIDAIIDPYSPALSFKGITWEEAVELCRLSFAQGYGAVIWRHEAEAQDG